MDESNKTNKTNKEEVEREHATFSRGTDGGQPEGHAGRSRAP